MVLEAIYVVRHGYRSNWVVDPQTGEYSTSVRTPTGIPSDPALASYGVQQAEQLASHLATVDPTVDLVYSSPFYRCLQTLAPFTDKWVAERGDDTPNTTTTANGNSKKVRVVVEPGLGEFYGLARFDHPQPASIEVLNTHFKNLHVEENAIVIPSTKGESIPGLHDRLAYCLSKIIERADADPSGPKALLICTHAASMICIGRALTGVMPEDEGEEDFKCFTCSFSKFTRKGKGEIGLQEWDAKDPETIPDVDWKGGKGVAGGWKCEVNGDCHFLAGGEERGWNFNIEKEQFSQQQQPKA